MNGIKMLLSLVIVIAFACIIPIDGESLSLDQKIGALEKRLDEMEFQNSLQMEDYNKRLSMVENKTSSSCSKHYV